MSLVRALTPVLAALLLAGSCGGEPEGGPSSPDLGEMFADVEDHVWHNGYEDGDWDPDWDDAPFYGPAFYSQTGWQWGRSDYQGRALEAVEHNLAVSASAISDPTGELVENVSAVIYGTMGVIEYMAASGEMEHLAEVDLVIDIIDDMVNLLGGYIDGFDSYAVNNYGPTSVTAVVIMLELQYAVLLDTERRSDRVESAQQLAANVEALAWNGTFYQFAPNREEELFLYPNVAMMIVNTRLHQATGDETYLERAEAVYEAIEPLRCPDRPGFRSPYSAEGMGAQTPDYSTLSSQCYAMFAFGLLAEQTGEQVYMDELEELMDFVETYLWVPGDGRVYHHWMDGRLALPEDPEYYCIGCNLQLLYLHWWIDEHLD